jgi:hypothetical protein
MSVVGIAAVAKSAIAATKITIKVTIKMISATATTKVTIDDVLLLVATPFPTLKPFPLFTPMTGAFWWGGPPPNRTVT